MVKDVSAKNLVLPFGIISMSVDDIIAVLRDVKFTSVTAKNGGMEFDSIDDIEENKQLFVGQPNIYADGINISFSRHGGGVRPFGYNQEPDLAKIASVHKKIIYRKSFFDKSMSIARYFSVPYIIFCVLLLVSFAIKNEVISPYRDISARYVLPPAFIVWACLFYAENIRQPVYYRAYDGFWNRNGDKVALAVIGALIGWLTKWLTG